MTDTNKNTTDGNCPICGYFVGIESTCVRCGARVKRRIAVRAVRRIALFGSVVGLVLLWVAAYLKEPEFIRIGDITETMNNAFVTIEGTVTRIQYDETKNTLRMTVNDATGDIKMNAFNKLKKFREILGENMPALKDRVKIAGTLNISQAWGITMFLSIPNRIKIDEKYIVKEVPVGKISSKDEGELYWITVEVIDYEEFTTHKGFMMHKFLLADKSGEIPMVLYSNEFNSLPKDIRTAITGKWNRFRMMVEVSVYRNVPQVKILDAKNPDYIKVSALSNKQKKKNVLLKKKVKDIIQKDIEKTYLISSNVEQVKLGSKGFFLNLEGSKLNLFIRYARQKGMKGFEILQSGSGNITAPMRVEMTDGKLELRIADFNDVKIKSIPPKKHDKPPAFQKINIKKPAEFNENIPVDSPAAIDLSELKKKKLKKITKTDINKIYLIEAGVKGIDLGTDGFFLNLDESDMELFIPYSYEEKIDNFSRLNSGKCMITAAMRVVSDGKKLGLRIADFNSLKVE